MLDKTITNDEYRRYLASYLAERIDVQYETCYEDLYRWITEFEEQLL
jgi:hypothetical protein